MNADPMDTLEYREFPTEHGSIRYWITPEPDPEKPWLVFLHGMLVDHRLFTKQLVHFSGPDGSANVLAWDSPGHNESRPFDLDAITLGGVAQWLIGILEQEEIVRPVLVGQSFGGMVCQAALQLRPDLASGFVCIDSVPLGRQYWNAIELAAARRIEPVLRMRPWKKILEAAPKETSESEYGQRLTREMLEVYDKEEYVRLAVRTINATADAILADLDYQLPCPTILVCGVNDATANSKRQNKRWAEETGRTVKWIPHAAHNANADNPAAVNAHIERFLGELAAGERRYA